MAIQSQPNVSVIDQKEDDTVSRIARMNVGDYIILVGSNTSVITFCDVDGNIRVWETTKRVT